MRALTVLGLAVASLVVCAWAVAGSSSGISLRVTYWENGSRPAAYVTWTLRCSPPGGTLEKPAFACRRIAAGSTKLFAPLPKDAVCTEIYGGPQRARVVGAVAGKRIWTIFRRTNGCEIGRWNRLSPWLLPPGGAS